MNMAGQKTTKQNNKRAERNREGRGSVLYCNGAGQGPAGKDATERRKMMKKRNVILLAYLLVLSIAMPTVSSAGTKSHEHVWGEWTVTSEPDCRRPGRKERVCTSCGGRQTEQIPRTSHNPGEWKIVLQATDFSKGRRTAVCAFCGITLQEDFYPEGTVFRDTENDPEAVRAIQYELKEQGFYQGKVTGEYGDSTVSAVRRAEEAWNLDNDGIAWPGFLRLLGLPGLAGRTPSESISKAVSAHRLQLSVKQTSPEKPYYAAGDELTYVWTLKNTHPTSKIKDAGILHFCGKKTVRKTDVQIACEEVMSPGDIASGIFIYTVTEEDAEAGTFSHGFVVRGRLGSQQTQSNTVIFVNASSASAAEKPGWKPSAAETLQITATVLNQPSNTFFFTEDETIRYRIEVRNRTGRTAENILLSDGKGEAQRIGPLAERDIWVCDLLYRVTGDDTGKGEVTATASLSYSEDGEAKQAAVFVRIPAGENENGLYIFTECISEPRNGRYFVPGETAEFRILIVNPSERKTFSAIRIYNPWFSTGEPYRTIAEAEPGTSAVCFFKTEVTAGDAEKGSLECSPTASYRNRDGKTLTVRSNGCTVSCGPAE